MTPEELVKIESKYNVAIIAPAGHGKTEMVADMVESSWCLRILMQVLMPYKNVFRKEK